MHLSELKLIVVRAAASMPVWLKWAFWLSPLAYGEIGLTVNEFLAPRWQKVRVVDGSAHVFHRVNKRSAS